MLGANTVGQSPTHTIGRSPTHTIGRSPTHTIGRYRGSLWLAALALWIQMLAGGVLPGLALAAIGSDAAICHADGGAHPSQDTPPPTHDCLACPICNALAVVHALPLPAAPVIYPPLAHAETPSPAVDEAGVVRRWRVASQPRGPPALA